jgi:hypothetical protein
MEMYLLKAAPSKWATTLAMVRRQKSPLHGGDGKRFLQGQVRGNTAQWRALMSE